MKRRCELLSISRSSVYYVPKEPAKEKVELEEKIKRRLDFWHTKLPGCGVRKLKRMLAEQDGIHVGRKLIRRYMTEMGIHAVYPKPNLSKGGNEHKTPYLLKNKLIFISNQVWAIDITYIPVQHGHMYLTAIIDWYSRYIVGWELSDTLSTAPVLIALERAIATYGRPGILNSDQGSQFTSEAYMNFLKEQQIRQSMDGKARWVDNVLIERWFRSLKTEYIYINEYNSPKELRAGIRQYIGDYNTLRPHQSFEYATPASVYWKTFAA